VQLGTVHKKGPQSGGGRLSSADIFRTSEEGSSSDADVRTFLGKKLRIFRNLWCVRTNKGLSQFGNFADKREKRSIFCDFVRTSFMDGPLKDVRAKVFYGRPVILDGRPKKTSVQKSFMNTGRINNY